MKRRYLRYLNIILIAGTVLAALKILFVGFSMDEEYQILMSYRRLSGDTLFGTMWEPHQTSAFVCTLLMRAYLSITGTYTGILLYLRVVTIGIQLLLSYWLFRVLSRILSREESVMLALLYFNIVPKLIQIPDFSNLQLWFWTGLVLCLMEYDAHPKLAGKPFWIILAGIFYSLEVLAYPSALFLLPFLLLRCILRSPKGLHAGFQNAILFVLSCVGCAAIRIFLILRKVGFAEARRNVGYILRFDMTHDLDMESGRKIFVLLQGLGMELILVAICLAVTLAVCRILRKREADSSLFADKNATLTTVCTGMILVACIIQLIFWVILQKGYELPQIHLLMAFFAGLILWRTAGKERCHFAMGLWTGIITICSVLYMSDLTFAYAIPHGMLAELFCVAVVLLAIRDHLGERATAVGRLLLVVLLLTAIIGKGFTMRGGRGETITSVGSFMKHGPAIGVFTEYMCSYIYNCDYEDYRANIAPGENVLIVSNMVTAPGVAPYFFGPYGVSHFSIVDPTSYDEKLLTYWELYPEKRPDAIVVDCWYGELMEDPNNWIMQYIENDFGYTSVVDGRYVRFYKK